MKKVSLKIIKVIIAQEGPTDLAIGAIEHNHHSTITPKKSSIKEKLILQFTKQIQPL